MYSNKSTSTEFIIIIYYCDKFQEGEFHQRISSLKSFSYMVATMAMLLSSNYSTKQAVIGTNYYNRFKLFTFDLD